MIDKDFDMAINSIRGSLAIEGIELDEAFVEEYRKYHQGLITWEDFKTMYPYIGAEPHLSHGQKLFSHVEKKLQEVNMAQNYKETEKGLIDKTLKAYNFINDMSQVIDEVKDMSSIPYEETSKGLEQGYKLAKKIMKNKEGR